MRSRKPPAERRAADDHPVARVLLDLPVAHLARTFEYLVPEDLSAQARPGVRVRVQFNGQKVRGYVVARAQEAEHPGALKPVAAVVSDEPVLVPSLLALCDAVATRYAGATMDVVRLAVPARHARAEQELAQDADPPPVRAPRTFTAWSRYSAGEALLSRVAAGEAPAAAWTALPSTDPAQDWPHAFAEAAAVALAAGRGVLAIAPDHRDVDRIAEHFEQLLGTDAVVRLTADLGPEARYTAWLKVLRGQVRCVVGNRAAAFAPVRDLGLVLCWDDDDSLLSEPRAPYPRIRDVLWLRHEQESAAIVFGGFTRSPSVEAWVRSGQVREVGRRAARAEVPRVVVAGDELEQERFGAAAHARLPASAWQAARAGLERGPVLVQVPRRGYVPRLRCSDCGTAARCARCHGPLQVSGADDRAHCTWCHAEPDPFRCPECDGARLKASVLGTARTAEELGRAFPGVPVVRSDGPSVISHVPARPALVVSTPGGEPVADGGYAAVLLLDAWAMLDRPSLDSDQQALRRWTAAAALARPHADGGVVVLAGADAALPIVQSLVRWAPAWFTGREYDERRDLSLPPTSWCTTVTGDPEAVESAVSSLPDWMERLGPTPLPSGNVRMVVRAPLERSEEASKAVHSWRVRRSIDRVRDDLLIRVDPDGSTL